MHAASTNTPSSAIVLSLSRCIRRNTVVTVFVNTVFVGECCWRLWKWRGREAKHTRPNIRCSGASDCSRVGRCEQAQRIANLQAFERVDGSTTATFQDGTEGSAVVVSREGTGWDRVGPCSWMQLMLLFFYEASKR